MFCFRFIWVCLSALSESQENFCCGSSLASSCWCSGEYQLSMNGFIIFYALLELVLSYKIRFSGDGCNYIFYDKSTDASKAVFSTLYGECIKLLYHNMHVSRFLSPFNVSETKKSFLIFVILEFNRDGCSQLFSVMLLICKNRFYLISFTCKLITPTTLLDLDI